MAGQSLADGLLSAAPAAARPAIQDYVYGTLRHFGRGDFFLSGLLEHPLEEKEIHALLLAALYRLEQRPESAYMIVDQAVGASTQIGGGRFKGLVNAVLRNFSRRREALLAGADADEIAMYRHPAWWLGRLKQAFPDHWAEVAAIDNLPPPMALRVNRRMIGRDEWMEKAKAAGIGGVSRGMDGVLLEQGVPVERLPGFAGGEVSVQDLGAQRAAEILSPATGGRVLDACAAPGGKTAHLLERSDVDLLALDLKPARCRRIEENLSRLKLRATVRAADCSRPATWWDDNPFDAVLADVPCTASGVVRRHPDAKWLRREEDIASFARSQSAILDALWQVVRPGGKLLYATCSVFPEENGRQIDRFIARAGDAARCNEEHLLPDLEHDGFYYCLVKKLV
ncbi:MAG: 16S rRNA (cytosine(967)-C(5))-methyltransferase RsmB [Betaproteobacteria bacterium]